MLKYERGGLNVPSTNLARIDLTFSPTYVDRTDAMRRCYGPLVAQQWLEGTANSGSARAFLGSALGFLGHGRQQRAHHLLLLRAMTAGSGGASTAPLLHVSTALRRCEREREKASEGRGGEAGKCAGKKAFDR